ncbi:hypothetical protein ABW21_db0206037 [Orbilia brochopaga]|nr:hypothetical protein ABW21_db0206037 [Drechslerella brochopaga]
MSATAISEKELEAATAKTLGGSNAIVTKIIAHSDNADDALKAFEGYDHGVKIDPETNRKLLRKIDLHIMPLLCVVYMLQFVDKVSLSYGSVTGLRQDLHLVGDNYSWLASIFNFGYLFWEYQPTA